MRFNYIPKSIVVDYTVDGQYKNDCHYFGQSSINIADWAQNNNIILTNICDSTDS